MKSLTLDSLRRLIGGHRKKDKHESSFKRSESFKRISIKKNYLDRGGKCRNPAAKFAMKKKAGATSAEEEAPTTTTKQGNAKPPPSTESLIIDYGEWIRCIQQEDTDDGKKADSEGSLLEVTKLEKSPQSPRRFPLSSKGSSSSCCELDDGSRTDSAISVSLGRIWMDAPLAMTNAPRSLELPRPISSAVEPNPNGQRAHHSLESALKDKKDECAVFSPRSCDILSSSKDSGFSFSISIPRLSPVVSQGHGFFRKKKPTMSKTKECRRTASYARRSRAKKSPSSVAELSDNLYQVVVNRAPRSLDALKLDPIIFVPPEKRKSTIKKTYEVREIRDYCVPCDAADDDDDFDKLYEVISGGVTDNQSVATTLWTSEEEDMSCSRSPVQQANYSPNPRRRVARKKSSRRNIRYVAKPIYRAPSTLKRNRRIVKKANGMDVILL